MGTATLSTRLCAIALGIALVVAQLLCGVHKAEALGHKPGGVCDLCLSLANVDHALVEAGAPPPVLGRRRRSITDPTRASPAPFWCAELRARSPPPSRLIPLAW